MSNPIRTYREQNRLSRHEVARNLGVSVAMVGHLETGIRKISAKRANQWAPILGVPREVLCPEIFGAQ